MQSQCKQRLMDISLDNPSEETFTVLSGTERHEYPHRAEIGGETFLLVPVLFNTPTHKRVKGLSAHVESFCVDVIAISDTDVGTTLAHHPTANLAGFPPDAPILLLRQDWDVLARKDGRGLGNDGVGERFRDIRRHAVQAAMAAGVFAHDPDEIDTLLDGEPTPD